ncbi:hypothetical protein DPMN_006171 [Dreissena polymorpha]|uniref:Uncharacterized protein n=1 Tax=Dreissena polymorpha TaxID=45954 RepID=A0A9D4MW02_DREPO|nr:hypothetical protein DPMN_006171 [Dreissena polymorpha]
MPSYKMFAGFCQEILSTVDVILKGNFGWARPMLVGPQIDHVIRNENCPLPGGHFHDDWAKNVTSIFTSFFSPIWTIFELVRDINKTNVLSNFHDWAKIVTCSVLTRKTAPPTGGHVFQQRRTTFKLNHHIIKTNILTNFQLHRDIIGTNLLTKFHEDRKKNVASRVFTRKTALSTGGHVFQQTRTTFELNQHIIKTNILTRFHKDWT